MTGTTPSAGFEYYVGVGIPPTERHASLRADAVVIGASLPALTAAELAAIPDAVKADEAFVPNGYLHASPADQSSCAHLDDVMRDASTAASDRAFSRDSLPEMQRSPTSSHLRPFHWKTSGTAIVPIVSPGITPWVLLSPQHVSLGFQSATCNVGDGADSPN